MLTESGLVERSVQSNMLPQVGFSEHSAVSNPTCGYGGEQGEVSGVVGGLEGLAANQACDGAHSQVLFLSLPSSGGAFKCECVCGICEYFQTSRRAEDAVLAPA